MANDRNLFFTILVRSNVLAVGIRYTRFEVLLIKVLVFMCERCRVKRKLAIFMNMLVILPGPVSFDDFCHCDA